MLTGDREGSHDPWKSLRKEANENSRDLQLSIRKQGEGDG